MSQKKNKTKNSNKKKEEVEVPQKTLRSVLRPWLDSTYDFSIPDNRFAKTEKYGVEREKKDNPHPYLIPLHLYNNAGPSIKPKNAGEDQGTKEKTKSFNLFHKDLSQEILNLNEQAKTRYAIVLGDQKYGPVKMRSPSDVPSFASSERLEADSQETLSEPEINEVSSVDETSLEESKKEKKEEKKEKEKDEEEEPSKEEPPKEEPPKEEPPKEEPPKEEPPKEEPPKEEPPEEKLAEKELAEEKLAEGELAKKEPPEEGPAKGDQPEEVPPKEVPPKEDLVEEVLPKEKLVKKIPPEEKLPEDSSSEMLNYVDYEDSKTLLKTMRTSKNPEEIENIRQSLEKRGRSSEKSRHKELIKLSHGARESKESIKSITDSIELTKKRLSKDEGDLHKGPTTRALSKKSGHLEDKSSSEESIKYSEDTQKSKKSETTKGKRLSLVPYGAKQTKGREEGGYLESSSEESFKFSEDIQKRKKAEDTEEKELSILHYGAEQTKDREVEIKVDHYENIANLPVRKLLAFAKSAHCIDCKNNTCNCKNHTCIRNIEKRNFCVKETCKAFKHNN